MEEHAESSTAAVLSRFDDPMSIALRSEGSLELDDIVDLQRNASPVDDVLSTVGSILPTAVFSSQKPSSGTKPTSHGSSHAKYHYHGKGKDPVTYASSISATQGSVSEADAEQEQALAGIGDWAGDSAAANRTLKGSARARKRQRAGRRLKQKKPVVIIQQRSSGHASAGPVGSPTGAQVACGSKETKYFRRRLVVRTDQDQQLLAEEGRGSQLTEDDESVCMPLTPVRVYILTALGMVIGLTLGLATFAARYAAAHYSGKGRVASTKGIVYTATVLVSGLSVLAMLVARRALHEALLAGLLQCAVGFVLVLEIHEFMM